MFEHRLTRMYDRSGVPLAGMRDRLEMAVAVESRGRLSRMATKSPIASLGPSTRQSLREISISPQSILDLASYRRPVCGSQSITLVLWCFAPTSSIVDLTVVQGRCSDKLLVGAGDSADGMLVGKGC